jgi:V/A-type H+/Na+-transporting ATPase subunit F
MAAASQDLRFEVATRPGDALGFRLAGVTVTEVPPGEEARTLRELVARPDLGVLAVEEEVLREAPEDVLRREREGTLPVLLPFALPRRFTETGRGRDYVAALIRRAVGYHVKLGEVRS